LFVVVVAAALLAPPAAAENYPTRPIRLYVAFPPGGAADIVARLVAQPLSARLGQPVVVENKPGSGGNIAGELIARAAPDGYSLLIGPDNLFTVNPHLFSKMSFDPLKDIIPIATVQSNALVLAINPKVPANDFKEFIALANRSDPPLFYASIGNGSLHHLAMEMLKQEAGIKLTHVPYRGGGPAGIAVLAGDVAGMFGGGSVFPMVTSGQLRGLAVSSRKRSTELSELPSISEFYPNYEAAIWPRRHAPGYHRQAAQRGECDPREQGFRGQAHEDRLGRALHHVPRRIQSSHPSGLRKIRSDRKGRRRAGALSRRLGSGSV